MRRAIVCTALLMGLLAGFGTPAAAQVSVSAADIQRLQDSAYELSGDVARMRSRDAARAEQLQTQLDELREEVTYLKVKLRKDGSVQRSEYTDVRDRLNDLRSRLYGDEVKGGVDQPQTTRQPAAGQTRPAEETPTQRVKPTGRSNELPVGTELDVRLQRELSSETAQVEDRFTATTMVDLMSDGRLVVPAGSTVRGIVTAVDKATRLERKGSLTLAFDEITVEGRSYPLQATVTEAIESEGVRGEVGKIGTGAGIGAIIGGILGGVKGALAGILIGAGGTIAATPGKDVTLPSGTVLRIRLDAPLQVRSGAR